MSKTTIEQLRELTKTQCNDGNWNFDEYMHGMANGMLIALSVMEENTPDLFTAPDTWLCDKTKQKAITKVALSHSWNEMIQSTADMSIFDNAIADAALFGHSMMVLPTPDPESIINDILSDHQAVYHAGIGEYSFPHWMTREEVMEIYPHFIELPSPPQLQSKAELAAADARSPNQVNMTATQVMELQAKEPKFHHNQINTIDKFGRRAYESIVEFYDDPTVTKLKI